MQIPIQETKQMSMASNKEPQNSKKEEIKHFDDKEVETVNAKEAAASMMMINGEKNDEAVEEMELSDNSESESQKHQKQALKTITVKINPKKYNRLLAKITNIKVNHPNLLSGTTLRKTLVRLILNQHTLYLSYTHCYRYIFVHKTQHP